MIRDEFKLEGFSNSKNETVEITVDEAQASDEVKLRLCFECFKKIANRLEELAQGDGNNHNEKNTTEMDTTKDVTPHEETSNFDY